MGLQGAVPSQPQAGPAAERNPVLVLMGASYRTCPIEERERFLRRVTYRRLRAEAGARPPWDDLVLLTTCNRIEIYALTRDRDAALDVLQATFGVPTSAPQLYVLDEREAAAHLFRVASGLDSLAQGEGQITDQVRRTADERPGAWRGDGGLEQLFARAARAAPKVRGLAGFTGMEASASRAAIRFVEQAVPVSHPCVLLLGTGKMARIGARALRGRAEVIVLNRDPRKARSVARSLGGRGAGMAQLATHLARADVIIAATSARKPLLTRRHLEAVANRRDGRPLWLVDLGFPRNIDPGCASEPGVTLADIDSLAPWGARPLPPSAHARAEAAVREEAERFVESLHPQTVLDVARFRRIAEAVRREEVGRALDRLPDLTDADRDVVDKLATRLVNRFLHGPTEQLRSLPDPARTRLVRELVAGLETDRGTPR